MEDSFKVTDEGGGIIRVDAESRLVRKALAEAMCAEVDKVAARYGGRFKILMNMGAMSKGTPGAGFYTLKTMKDYDMTALAMFRANSFMRGMAKVVLALNGFTNFALFEDEVEARSWLEHADAPGSPNGQAAPPAEPRRRLPQAAAAAALGVALSVLIQRRRRRVSSPA